MSCKLSMNWIIPKVLAVGDYVSSSDAPILKANNIKLVITARGQLSQHPEYYKKHGIHVLHIPVSDTSNTNIGQYFSMVYRYIEYYAQQGHAILIHCAAGISRSTTLVTSYIMRKYQLPFMKAIEFVKKSRPCMDPNPGFIMQLNQYEKLLRKHNIIK
jgi:dual specificity phosphatase 12